MADKPKETRFTASEIQDQIAETIHYSDSASQVGQRSVAESVASSVSSARLRAAAERAALEAEIAASSSSSSCV